MTLIRGQPLDLLDFVFDTLREHEAVLDALVNRLDKSVNRMEFTLIEDRLAKEKK